MILEQIKEYFEKYKVTAIASDSRLVKPGYAFFAIKGNSFDGNQYIQQARDNGAVLIFTSERDVTGDDVIFVEDTRLSLAIAASIIYPQRPEKLLAVTGTNGKTSVVSYCYQLLKLMQVKAAAIGTLGIIADEDVISGMDLPNSSLTTTDAINFHRILHELAISGVKVAAFEASSHGLVQQRIGEIKVDAAGFTSFSQDHLDYHRTMSEYLDAKLMLFSSHLSENAIAVLNADIARDTENFEFFKASGINYKTVSKDATSDLYIKSVTPSLTGQVVKFAHGGRDYEFTTKIIGSFQAVNLLIAAEMLASVGYDFDKIIQLMPQLEPVSGRLQKINNQDYHIFIDYAHTPDALEKSLSELRQLRQGYSRLFVVFGCGGDRDKTKRKLMGKVAAFIADYVIVTDDNPRTEQPETIRSEIMQGISNGENTIEIAGREEAINRAVDLLQKGDILLIAGKGHEDYQIIGTEILPFSDFIIAEKYLQKKL